MQSDSKSAAGLGLPRSSTAVGFAAAIAVVAAAFVAASVAVEAFAAAGIAEPAASVAAAVEASRRLGCVPERAGFAKRMQLVVGFAGTTSTHTEPTERFVGGS